MPSLPGMSCVPEQAQHFDVDFQIADCQNVKNLCTEIVEF
jgi:hypothetical protein